MPSAIAPAALQHHVGVGHFDRVSRGCYRLIGVPVDPHEDIVAAWLKHAPRASKETSRSTAVDSLHRLHHARMRVAGRFEDAGRRTPRTADPSSTRRDSQEAHAASARREGAQPVVRVQRRRERCRRRPATSSAGCHSVPQASRTRHTDAPFQELRRFAPRLWRVLPIDTQASLAHVSTACGFTGTGRPIPNRHRTFFLRF